MNIIIDLLVSLFIGITGALITGYLDLSPPAVFVMGGFTVTAIIAALVAMELRRGTK